MGRPVSGFELPSRMSGEERDSCKGQCWRRRGNSERGTRRSRNSGTAGFLMSSARHGDQIKDSDPSAAESALISFDWVPDGRKNESGRAAGLP